MDWQEYNKQFPAEKVYSLPAYYEVFNDRFNAERFLIDLINDDYYVKCKVVQFNNKFYLVSETE